MVSLIMLFCFVCFIIAYLTGRIGAWLYLKKRCPVLVVCAFTALIVLIVYLLAIAPPNIGTVLVALPFAIGFGAGNAVYIIALVSQGLFTWILSLLFFWGICRLKKYDEEYENKHKSNT